MHSKSLIAVGACALVLYGSVVSSQRAGQGAASAPAVPNLPTGKTMFWAAAETEARWKENETLKRFNSRLFNGPTNISANVRIVLPGDPPLTHETTADLWIVTAGSAIARTDGKVVDCERRAVNQQRDATHAASRRRPVCSAGRASSLHGCEGIQGLADALRHDRSGAHQAGPGRC